MDFTLSVYDLLLKQLQKNGYNFYRFDHYFANRDLINKDKRVVLLRHDVDRKPKQALKMAILESGLGIFGTYYFRCKNWILNEEIIKAIHAYRHEIGYHYESLSDSHGDYEQAYHLMKSNLDRLREICPVRTISMHSRPLSKWDNRLIFDRYSLSDFDLSGETYRSIDHNDYMYIADSGRNWNSNRIVVWDSVQGIQLPYIAKGTRGLIEYMSSNDLKVQLLIHPNRWSNNVFEWIYQYACDIVINAIKKAILIVRRNTGSLNE